MSIAEGSILLWSDIKQIYTDTNKQRKRWSVSAITVPENPGLVKPNVVSTLKSAIEDLKSTSAGSIANTGIKVPSTGQLIEPDPFLLMQKTLKNLAAANVSFNSNFNSSFNSNFNSNFNSSFRSSNFSGNHRFGSCFTAECSCDSFYSQSDYRSGFGGNTDSF